MRERPIIFNADMVRAVLDGRKTQTRRIMRVQPESNQFGLRRIIASAKRSDTGKYHWTESNATGSHIRSAPFSCPFGAVGDRLWVREAFAAFDADWIYPGRPQDLKDGPWPNVVFPADGVLLPPGTCRPSIHMPRWASRITLEITGVRVERLQDISEQDAWAEGFEGYDDDVTGGKNGYSEFCETWMGIYGADSWQANPWVWVIEFKRAEVE